MVYLYTISKGILKYSVHYAISDHLENVQVRKDKLQNIIQLVGPVQNTISYHKMAKCQHSELYKSFNLSHFVRDSISDGSVVTAYTCICFLC